MNDTTYELSGSDEEIFPDEVSDEQLEAAADPTKPTLWTYHTSSCGGGYPPYCG